jgi:hypothetical protein
MQSYIGPDELVFNNDVNGNIHSGGFNVNSIMMKNGMSPIMTWNESNASQIGGAEKVSDLFNNLVIPNWSISYNYKHLGGSRVQQNKENEDNNDEVITEDLHEKLLNLVRASNDEIKQTKNKISKKKNNKNNKKTKKQKKQKIEK